MPLISTIRTLSALTILLNFGCAGMPTKAPKPPEGNVCVLSPKESGGYCEPLATVYRKSRVLKQDMKADALIPFTDMDNWIAYDPVTATNIEIYINELKAYAKENCQ